MNRKTVTAFFVGSITATIASGAASALLKTPTPRGSSLRLVNAELVFANSPDGGTHTRFRACGYEEMNLLDGGSKRLGEPCWSGEVDSPLTAPLTKALLNQGAPLLTP